MEKNISTLPARTMLSGANPVISNKVLITSSLSTINPTAEGIVNSKTVLIHFISVILYSLNSSFEKYVDKVGSMAIPIPCANIPYGICHVLSAILRIIILPGSKSGKRTCNHNIYLHNRRCHQRGYCKFNKLYKTWMLNIF